MKIEDFQDTRKTKFSSVPKIALQFLSMPKTQGIFVHGRRASLATKIAEYNDFVQ